MGDEVMAEGGDGMEAVQRLLEETKVVDLCKPHQKVRLAEPRRRQCPCWPAPRRRRRAEGERAAGRVRSVRPVPAGGAAGAQYDDRRCAQGVAAWLAQQLGWEAQLHRRCPCCAACCQCATRE